MILSSRLAAGALLGAVVVVTACSSSADGEDASSSHAQALATSRCDFLERCLPFALAETFGDRATCVAKFEASLGRELALKGVALDDAKVNACAARAKSLGCLEPRTPTECELKGTLADGAACASDFQCASGQCYVEGTSSSPASTEGTCGVCKALATAGGDCTSTSCAAGLNCSSESKCVAGRSAGEVCTDAYDCAGSLQCQQGKCAAPLAAGAACHPSDTSAGSCDGTAGLFCVPTSATAGTCQAASLAAVGAPCGYDATAKKMTLCKAGSCSSLTDNGTCLAPLGEGAACGTGEAACDLDLVCTAGTCQKSNGASCTP